MIIMIISRFDQERRAYGKAVSGYLSVIKH